MEDNILTSKITRDRFSTEFVFILQRNLGFNTIGDAKKFLDQVKPSARFGCGIEYVRADTLKNELDQWLNSEKIKQWNELYKNTPSIS